MFQNSVNMSNKHTLTYSVSMGMKAQIIEQTRDTYRGGGVIPAVIP